MKLRFAPNKKTFYLIGVWGQVKQRVTTDREQVKYIKWSFANRLSEGGKIAERYMQGGERNTI